MPWNEPGNNKKDPWGGSNNNEPPDLDEIFKKFQRSLGGLFGGSGGGRGNNSGFAATGGLIFFILFGFWLIWCSYLIDEQEEGIVLQFGKYLETRPAGFNFVFQPVQTLQKVNVSAFRNVKQKASMLTQDENIVDVEYAVQYNINNPERYLFSVKNPEQTLSEASESAIREIVGKNSLDYVIKEGREVISTNTKGLLQEILDRYEAGLNVIKVNIAAATPPKDVLFAFEDVNKAREDKERYVREAEAYRNEILPVARGEAQRLIEDANAYKSRVINGAKGEADRFTKLLKEYQKAPKVTRERLYIDAVETVLSNSNTVVVDVKQGNNMMYLPLDQIIRQSRTAPNSGSARSRNDSTRNSVPSAPSRIDDNRGRERR